MQGGGSGTFILLFLWQWEVFFLLHGKGLGGRTGSAFFSFFLGLLTLHYFLFFCIEGGGGDLIFIPMYLMAVDGWRGGRIGIGLLLFYCFRMPFATFFIPAQHDLLAVLGGYIAIRYRLQRSYFPGKHYRISNVVCY